MWIVKIYELKLVFTFSCLSLKNSTCFNQSAMKSKIILIAACFLSPVFVFAQHHGAFKKYEYVQGTDTLPYRLLLPAFYDPSKQYPLIIFLHGAGERGNNNESQLNHGGRVFKNDSIMLNYPAIIVFPQCSRHSAWGTARLKKDSATKRLLITYPKDLPPRKDMELVMDLIPELETNYPIDKERLYVGGLSLGGIGTYELVYRMPDTFAAAFVMCGAGDTANAKKMKETSWWIFNGQKDSAIYVEHAIAMSDALKSAGASVKLTVYPEDGHNCWDDAFIEPGLFDWMFEKKLKANEGP